MTTTTTIEVFQKAAELGIKLGVEPPDTLTVEPARLCSAEFAEVLKAHKPALLALLKLPFVMVFSQILGETLLFCEDEDTKGVLVEAGADLTSVYTRADLRVLIEQHRRAPITAAELLRIHRARRAFNGRLTG
jgi:hypothetical protein